MTGLSGFPGPKVRLNVPKDQETFQEKCRHFSCTFAVKRLSGIYLSSSLKTGTERGCGLPGLARSKRANGHFGELKRKLTEQKRNVNSLYLIIGHSKAI